MSAMKKEFRKNLPVLSLVILTAAVFLFSGLFFSTRFYPGTVINGIKVSCLTTGEADRKLAERASSYVLVLHGRNGVKEVITGPEIGLEFGCSFGSSYYKKMQNRTFWALSNLKPGVLTFGGAFTYDESLLRSRYDNLSCTDDTKTVEPKNAGLAYSNGSFQIIREVYGNQVIDEILYPHIQNVIKSGKSEINLEQINCYLNPTIKWDSPKILNTKIVADGYAAAKVIYQFTGGAEVVDGDEISSWIEFDHDLNISFNKGKIAGYLRQLASHYDTFGKERDFVTSSGEKIKIGGGDYGWKVDIRKETETIIEIIMSGLTVVKEPEFSQRGALRDTNDIGPTYVEIDLTKQHLWFYSGGILIVQGAIVSGNISKGYKTPEGIYSLKYKIRNAVLRGENYESSVSYWMPFNNDIGIHDAPWRKEFGRNIYLTRGSHGCINAPVYLAETLFKRISVGTPIVCYY